MLKSLQRISMATMFLLVSGIAEAGPGGDMERLINQDQLVCSGTKLGVADSMDRLVSDLGDLRLDCSGNAAPMHATTLRNLVGLRWMVSSVSHDVTLIPTVSGRPEAVLTVFLVVQRNLFSQGLTR